MRILVFYLIHLINCFLFINGNDINKRDVQATTSNPLKCYYELDTNFFSISADIIFDVNSAEECCDFCNKNNDCVVWSLNVATKTCWIKSQRGLKSPQSGIISGYSYNYYLTLDKTVPITTTPSFLTQSQNQSSTTVIFTTTTPTTTTPATSTTTSNNRVCDPKNHYYFTGPPSGLAYGITEPVSCCSLCQGSINCQAYSYFGYNQTCLLYYYAGVYITQCIPEQQCVYSKVGSSSGSTPVVITTTTTASSLTSIKKIVNMANIPLAEGTCFYENGYSYASTELLVEFINSNLSSCCQSCFDNPVCQSWTLSNDSPSGAVCRLYKDYQQNKMQVQGSQSGFTSRYTIVHKLYVGKSDYILRYSNLNKSYEYLNNYYGSNSLLSIDEIDQLNKVLKQQSDALKQQLNGYLDGAIYKINIENLRYDKLGSSVYASFSVLLDPSTRDDLSTSNYLLNKLNLLFTNDPESMNNREIIQNNFKFYDEPNTNTSFLPLMNNFMIVEYKDGEARSTTASFISNTALESTQDASVTTSSSEFSSTTSIMTTSVSITTSFITTANIASTTKLDATTTVMLSSTTSAQISTSSVPGTTVPTTTAALISTSSVPGTTVPTTTAALISTSSVPGTTVPTTTAALISTSSVPGTSMPTTTVSIKPPSSTATILSSTVIKTEPLTTTIISAETTSKLSSLVSTTVIPSTTLESSKLSTTILPTTTLPVSSSISPTSKTATDLSSTSKIQTDSTTLLSSASSAVPSTSTSLASTSSIIYTSTLIPSTVTITETKSYPSSDSSSTLITDSTIQSTTQQNSATTSISNSFSSTTESITTQSTTQLPTVTSTISLNTPSTTVIPTSSESTSTSQATSVTATDLSTDKISTTSGSSSTTSATIIFSSTETSTSTLTTTKPILTESSSTISTTTINSESFALFIKNGLAFSNVNNVSYDFLQFPVESLTATDRLVYNNLTSSLKEQLLSYTNRKIGSDFISSINIANITYNKSESIISVDYEFLINQQYNQNITTLKDQLDKTFANANNTDEINIVLSINNDNNTLIKAFIPNSNSNFIVRSLTSSTTITPELTSSTTSIIDYGGKYLGCYKDSKSQRDINFNSSNVTPFTTSSMTIKWCIEKCRSISMPFAGLQMGEECWCGLSFGSYGRLNDSSCVYRCSGDNSTRCGGLEINSVWSVDNVITTTSSQETTQTTNATTNLPISSGTSSNPSSTTQLSTVETSSSLSTSISQENRTISSSDATTFMSTSTISVINSTLSTSSITNSTTLTTSFDTTSTISTSTTMTSTSINNTTISMVDTSTLSGFTPVSNASDTIVPTTTTPTVSSTSTSTMTDSSISSTTTISTTLSSTITTPSTSSSTSATSSATATITTDSSTVTTTTTTATTTSSTTTTSTTTTTTTTTSVTTTSTTTTTTTSISVISTNAPTTTTTTTTTIITTTTTTATSSTTSTTRPTTTTTTSINTRADTPVTTSTTIITTTTTTATTTTTTTTTKTTSPTNTSLTMAISGTVTPSGTDNPNIITTIRVDKNLDITKDEFKNNITKGLASVYAQAFYKAYKVLVQNPTLKSRIAQPPSATDIKVYVSRISATGDYSADSAKKNVDLKYYLVRNNNIVPVEYAHDSVNLLNDQEVATILQYEVVEKAYMEKSPRTQVVEDQRLWIIGAVLGPIALLVLIFWGTGFIYYKCISPRRSNDNNRSEISKSSTFIPVSKVQPQNLPTTSSSALIDPSPLNTLENEQSNLERPGDVLVSARRPKIRINPETETSKANETTISIESKTKSYQLKDIYDSIEGASNVNAFSRSNDLQKSIKQKTEIEKWRNKQRQREKVLKDQEAAKNSYLESSNDILYIDMAKDYKSRHKSDDMDHVHEPNDRQRMSAHEDRFNMLSSQKQKSRTATGQNERTKTVSAQIEEELEDERSRSHQPVRVHVSNKPNIEELNRVYNPYQVKEEYESYVKQGFLFEPLKSSTQTMSTFSTNNFNKTPINHSNITLKSETTAPHKYKSGEPVRTSYTNKAFEEEPETQFKNFNQLKTTSSSNKNSANNIELGQIPRASTANIKTRVINDDDDNDTNEINSRNNKPKQSYDSKFYFNDEYDLANKYRRTNVKTNLELLNSINKEIQRIKTGLDGDSSNA